jgi:Glycosyl transferases group 1
LSTPSARTLLFSQRNLDRMVYQCWKYEFEDVIAEVDAVDVIAPAATPEGRIATRAGRRLVNSARRRVGLLPMASMGEVRVSHSYDLFFAAFLFPDEVRFLDKLKGWRERCKIAVCFLGEVWNKDVELLRACAPLLRQFDRIFLHVGASVPMVASVLGRPCQLIFSGIDAARFCPFPDPPARVVDCYSFGRRSPSTHQALLRLAANRRFFYVYDTVSQFPIIDPGEHRRLTAEVIKRSHYFIAYKHNLDVVSKTGGDEALGSRLFEGMAGGSVILGAAPDCPELATVFDWPDAVIPIPYEVADMAPILADLDGQPERIDRARRNNVAGALRRHDWGHRWATILDAVGLAPLPALEARRARLTALADLVAEL